jgi:polar amino acid transport system permease protein
MATTVTSPVEGSVGSSIVDRIAVARRRRRFAYLAAFAITWLVIIGAIIGAIVATGNWSLEFTSEWGPYILGGVGYTIFVCVASILLAILLAIFGALGRLSLNPVINGIASLYVSLVRGTPLLVQVYFVFFALPSIGIVLDPIPAGVFALGFNYGAYLTEIFRAGIQAVPSGQREAAQALGMRDSSVMRRIVLPQAFRIVIPPIGNEFIAMIKDSSLVSVVSLQEILWRARKVGTSNHEPIQAFIIAAAIYWILSIVFSYLQERLERRMARGDR